VFFLWTIQKSFRFVWRIVPTNISAEVTCLTCVIWKIFLHDCSCNDPSDVAVILKSQYSINWLELCMRDFLWARQLSCLCPDLSKILSWFSFVTLVETLRCLAFAIKKFFKWYVECYADCNFSLSLWDPSVVLHILIY